MNLRLTKVNLSIISLYILIWLFSEICQSLLFWGYIIAGELPWIGVSINHVYKDNCENNSN